MTKKFNFKKGRMGEDIALKYLVKKGYKLIDKNARDRYGELDLVMVIESRMIFVEVKARNDICNGLPEDSINTNKLRRLRFAAQRYVYTQKFTGEYQIDTICIIFSTGKIVHHQAI